MLPSGAFNASIAACRSDALRRTTRTTPLFEVTAPYGMRLSRSVVRTSRSSRSSGLRDRALDVDFVDEVHAAAQIEAEAHRLQADRAASTPACAARSTARPGSRPESALVMASRALACCCGVGEAQHQAVLLEVRRPPARPSALRRTPSTRCCAASSIGCAVVARQLQRRAFAEHVRQREQRADHHDDDDQPVLPRGKLIHGESAATASAQTLFRVPFGSTCATVARWTLTFTPSAISSGQILLAELRHLAEDAAVGDDFGPDLERGDHGAVLLGALGLRTDQQEVEDHEHQDQRTGTASVRSIARIRPAACAAAVEISQSIVESPG